MAWSCEDCKIKFYSRATYYRHRKLCAKSTQKLIFKTCNCGKPFYSKTNFYAHRKHCKENTEKNIFKTCDCGKNFAAKTTYYEHKKTCAEEKKTDAANENILFKRCDCGTSFFDEISYLDHKKCCIAESKNNKFLPKENYKCQEENCIFSCKTRFDFLSHLKNNHSIDSSWEEKTFQSYKEFEDWKEHYEKSTMAAFKISNVKKTLSGTHKNFICNRSGSYKSQSTGKRGMKSQGTSKIGFNCPASIKVHLEENSSVVKATICSFHYGHDNELKHLRIFKSERVLIAYQLSMGIEPSHIQNNLYSLYPTELQRQHLTTKVDIKNIAKSYGIDKIEKHSADPLSVDAYVKQTSPGTWLVYSEKSLNSKTSLSYVVKKQAECTKNCQIKCQYCCICLHSYICNCPDAIMMTTICKHVHLVVRSQKTEITATCTNQAECSTSNSEFVNINEVNNDLIENCLYNQPLESTSNGNEKNSEVESSSNANEPNPVYQNFDKNNFLQLFTSNVNTSVMELQSNLLCKTMALSDLIKQCQNKDLLLSARTYINSAAYLLKLKPSTEVTLHSSNKMKRFSSKRNVERQLGFHSTKKKKT